MKLRSSADAIFYVVKLFHTFPIPGSTSCFSISALYHQMFQILRFVANVCVLLCYSVMYTQIHLFCKMISDFSLEYRTLYSKMLQRNEKRKRKTGVLIPTVSLVAFTMDLIYPAQLKWNGFPTVDHMLHSRRVLI